jgi:hypothetical protein
MTTEQVERPEQMEKTPDGLARRWMQEIDDASKRERGWRRDAVTTEEVYSDEKGAERFNILFSNTATLAPALINSTPRPDVRRRFRDKDPVGKAVSEILERALSYSVDSYDFMDTMDQVILDYLLPGRGIARVRYVPTYGDPVKERIAIQADTPDALMDDEDAYMEGEEYEPVVHEEAVCEHVQWDDFRILGDVRSWNDVPAIAFRHRMTRKQLVAEFGEIGSEVPLNDSARENGEDKPREEMTQKAEIWEVWDKDNLRVLFVTQGFNKPLDVREDPLGLNGFFPVPRPLVSVPKPRSMVPKPEYFIYKAQADELNKISARIIRLTDAIKARGIYNPVLGDNLSRLTDNSDDAILQPADKEAVNQLFSMTSQVDFQKQVWWMPIDMLAAVMLQLLQQRDQIKQTIYEITGISDILRGASNAQETASAQRIKAQFGSLRLKRRQSDVQRFIRDLFRLKAEIFAEQFDPETLSVMTGIELPTEQEKAMAQQAVQAFEQQKMVMGQMQQQGMPLPPEAQQQVQQYQQQAEQAQEVLKKPSWEQVMQVMRDDLLRGYKIDVETDSTIEADEAYDQRSLAELYKGIGDFSATVGPLVQQGALPLGAFKAMLVSAARKFKMGRQVEDELEQIPDQPPQQQNPDAEAAKVEAEKAKLDLQMKQAEAQMRTQKMEENAAHERQRLQMDMQRMQAEAANDQAELAIKREELSLKQAELGLKRQEMQMRYEEANETNE